MDVRQKNNLSFQGLKVFIGNPEDLNKLKEKIEISRLLTGENELDKYRKLASEEPCRLNSVRDNYCWLNATKLYAGNSKQGNLSGFFSKAVKQGKEIIFLVTAKEDAEKVREKVSGWKSLSEISMRLKDNVVEKICDILSRSEKISITSESLGGIGKAYERLKKELGCLEIVKIASKEALNDVVIHVNSDSDIKQALKSASDSILFKPAPNSTSLKQYAKEPENFSYTL